MAILLTRRAQRRALERWAAQAAAAWSGMARLHAAAWAAELDGHGDPRVTLRWQVLMARVRFYWQRCVATLAMLREAQDA